MIKPRNKTALLDPENCSSCLDWRCPPMLAWAVFYPGTALSTGGLVQLCWTLPIAPHSPLIACNLLPDDFMTCEEPLDLKGNATARQELGYGCLNFGGQKYQEVEFTSVMCTALSLIECHGNRTFPKAGVPCIRYTNHYFLTTLLYSILLGLAGIDRFCLGHVGAAVGKLLTLGGAGLWWIKDIIALITGDLLPEDGSNWVPYV